MKKELCKRKRWFLLCLFPLLFSCDDKMSDHYENPGLKSSIWELLEERGNYSIFLSAVERSGFRPYLEGKGIATVMAPDDEAFTSYFATHNTSIESMPLSDLKKLVGFHLLYYSYNKSNLENFRPEGQSGGDASGNLGAGMYYKFRTRSSNSPTKASSTQGEITLYHLERFIPIFSHNFFKTKKIENAERNYKFFYPDSEWTGANGFNVSGASVKEYELAANNGYVYTIDRVLEPMETIYDELKNNPAYSTFLNLYDSYSYYEYDATLSADFGHTAGVDSLYLHKHNYIPPIALEWPVSNFVLLNTLASVSYSIFALSNDALTDFYNRYWAGRGYASIYTLDPLIRRYFLYEFLYAGSVVFPDQITKGEVESYTGNQFNFDPYSLSYKKMCINGSLYGLDKIDVPVLFASVIGPAFREKEFACFLYTLDGSGTLTNYSNQDFKYTVLMPNESAFNNSNYGLKYGTTSNSLVENPDSDEPLALSPTKMANIVDSHVLNREVELKETGVQVLASNIPYNYWFVKDGKITCNRYFNKLLTPGATFDPFVPFRKIEGIGAGNWNNGRVYAYDASIANGGQVFDTDNQLVSFESNLVYALFNVNDTRYSYYAFSQLLKKAGLLVNGNIPSIKGRYIAFIPTNEAIEKALTEGRLPGAKGTTLSGEFDQAVLKAYLSNYFIDANSITTYPYPGSDMRSGAYETYGGNSINYIDNGTSLSVQLQGKSVIPVLSQYYYFPFAYNDGAFHFINEIF